MQQREGLSDPHPESSQNVRDHEPIADLSALPEAIAQGWTHDELFGLCMVEYPRWLHSLEPRQRQRMLSRRPGLTGTVWDAAIGASMEHGALIHDETPPKWVEEPRRFMRGPVQLLPHTGETALCHLPAPFTRRGIVTDPRTLDRRTGDEQWSPELGDPEERWPQSTRPNNRDIDEYLARLNAVLYEQKPATPFETGGPSLHNSCASIERHAAENGWVVRISVAANEEPATFVLRGPMVPGGRIKALPPELGRKLIRQALEDVGLNEAQWRGLLRIADDASGRNGVPPQTIWNRPTLTIAGTAAGIREQWQNAKKRTAEES